MKINDFNFQNFLIFKIPKIHTLRWLDDLVIKSKILRTIRFYSTNLIYKYKGLSSNIKVLRSDGSIYLSEDIYHAQILPEVSNRSGKNQ